VKESGQRGLAALLFQAQGFYAGFQGTDVEGIRDVRIATSPRPAKQHSAAQPSEDMHPWHLREVEPKRAITNLQKLDIRTCII
jgi:hypothetical protein